MRTCVGKRANENEFFVVVFLICPFLVAAFFPTLINTKRELAQRHGGIADREDFPVTCTDASCFLFSEARLPVRETRSRSGTLLLRIFINHTKQKRTHAGQTDRDGGANHANVDTLIFRNLSASRCVPSAFPLVERRLETFHSS